MDIRLRGKLLDSVSNLETLEFTGMETALAKKAYEALQVCLHTLSTSSLAAHCEHFGFTGTFVLHQRLSVTTAYAFRLSNRVQSFASRHLGKL